MPLPFRVVSGDVYQLDTSDLILEEEEPQARRPRAIKEKTRMRPDEKPEESPTSLKAKAVSFFEQALEAQRAGDPKAAIRHIKLAITFDPSEVRYRDLLSRLGR